MKLTEFLHEKLGMYFLTTLALCIGASLILEMFSSIMPRPISDAELSAYTAIAVEYNDTQTFDDISDIKVEQSGSVITVYNKEKPLSPAVFFTFDDDDNITRTKTGINPYALYTFPSRIVIKLIVAVCVAIVITFFLLIATWVKGRL